MNDPVHSPAHYKSGGIEVIDVIEAFGLDSNFRLANVIKYVLRAGRKGDALQDLEKAAWYLDREIDKLEDKAEADKVDDDAAHAKPVACAAKPESKRRDVDVTSCGSLAKEALKTFLDMPIPQLGQLTTAFDTVVPIDQREYEG